MKYMIIGYSGSGKSTLAKMISQAKDIPLLYLDTVQFLPNWEERTLEEKIIRVTEFLDSHDEWVIDGNYSKVCYERRLEEANQIIFMNFNRFNCFYRCFKRFLHYRNKSRESISEGCNEKFDLEFMKWILYEGRTKETRNRYKTVCEKYSDKVVAIHNQRELNKYTSSLICLI